MLTSSSAMRLIGLILVAFLAWATARAQPCKRLDIDDKKQRKILNRFIHECQAKGFLSPHSGYIYLREWVDQQHQLNWQVGAQKTWQSYPWIAPFLDHCTECIAPVGWTKIANRLVMRYTFDQLNDTLTKHKASCLLNLVANYVTILPPLPVPPKTILRLDSKGRPILDKKGKPTRQEYIWKERVGSDSGLNTHITFKKDGSVEKGLSL